MIKLGLGDITAISNVYRLNILEVFAIAIKIYARKRVILVLDLVIDVYIECYIFCAWRPFLDLLDFIKFWLGTFHKFPPGIIWSTASAIIPFIYVDGICAQAFDLGLNIMLQA